MAGWQNCQYLWNAAAALGKTGDPQTVEPLINLLRHRSNVVRWSAIRGLDRTKDPRGAEALISVLGEGAPPRMRRRG